MLATAPTPALKARSFPTPLVFACVISVAVLCIYLPGLSNDLLFDDLRLSDGTIFGQYGSLAHLKPRMLSYGSFIWIEHLLGAGWATQRAVNIALHLATVAALYLLLRELLARTRFAPEFEAQPHFQASRTAALEVGLALFALNPVAVYAVGYLTQRSILMATLFSTLACWAFLRGLVSGRAAWHGLALLSYLAAVLSKEYAVMTVALAVPLFIYVRHPPWKTIAVALGAALALLAVVAGVLFGFYGDLVGKLIDPRSIALARQLEALRPGIGGHIYALSVLNEAALFFVYGLFWFVPNVLWMSIDLRPAFPLSLAAMPQLLGALGFVALLAGAFWALLRGRGALALAALLLLFPLLLYPTEFATVWVQDPLVLYRSYLWAIAVPGLVAVALTASGFTPRTLHVIGIVVGLVFGTLAFGRVLSLKDAHAAWGDAADKIDLEAPANAVGRDRPFLNLGAWYLNKGSLDEAAQAYRTAHVLGDVGGNASFSLGVVLQQQKKHAEALAAFDAAQAGGFSGQALDYQRGEAQLALRQVDKAYASFDAALKQPPDNELDREGSERMLQTLRLRRAESAIGAGQYAAAIGDFTELLKVSPENPRLLLGLGLAFVGKGDTATAEALFTKMIAAKPSAPAFYGRAVARFSAGQKDVALKDIDQAIALDPRNPQYPQVRAQIAAGVK